MALTDREILDVCKNYIVSGKAKIEKLLDEIEYERRDIKIYQSNIDQLDIEHHINSTNNSK